MVNAINWQTIIQLSTSEDEEEVLYRTTFPMVSAACKDFNNNIKTFKQNRSNYIKMAQIYLDSEELSSNVVIVDTIVKDVNGFCSIPDFNLFRQNLNKFYSFINQAFSPTMDYMRYITDVVKFKESLYRGNKNVKKVKDILTNTNDLLYYFNYLTSPIEFNTINELVPNYPTLTDNDKNRIYPIMIRMVSDYLLKKELLEFFIRLFEVTGKKDIISSTESLDYMESIDNEMLYSFESISNESLEYMSLEAADGEGGKTDLLEHENAFLKFFEKVKDKLQAIPSQLSTFKKKAEMFFQKRKNIRLYKRVLGKIPSLYKRYGSETEIDENLMNDDPVQILAGHATEYIINLGKHTGEISDKLTQLSQSLATDASYDTMKMKIEDWIENSPLKTKEGELSEEVDKLPERMRKATRAMLVEAILEGNEIYGFTAESMVLKKFPPPNHTVVSLFVENPFEKPVVQRVTDIFKSAESFEIMANSDKRNIFSVAELQAAVLKNKITAETFKAIDRKRKDTLKRLKMKNGAISGSAEIKDERIEKENEKIVKLALKGVKLSIKEVAKMKVYVMDCINIYFSMMLRIDNLCLAAINAMLVTEKKASDSGYNLGEGKALKGKEYTDDEGNVKYGKHSEAGKTANKVNKRTDAFSSKYGG